MVQGLDAQVKVMMTPHLLQDQTHLHQVKIPSMSRLLRLLRSLRSLPLASRSLRNLNPALSKSPLMHLLSSRPPARSLPLPNDHMHQSNSSLLKLPANNLNLPLHNLLRYSKRLLSTSLKRKTCWTPSNLVYSPTYTISRPISGRYSTPFTRHHPSPWSPL